MLKCLNKIITGVLAVSCLSVAAVNVRLMMNTSHSQEFHIPSLKIATKIAENNISIVNHFETKLADISFPVAAKKTLRVVTATAAVAKIAETEQFKNIELTAQAINYDEPVTLKAIKLEYSLPTNLVALLPAFNFEEKIMIAETIVGPTVILNEEDMVSTVQAAAAHTEEEPIFFDYPTSETESNTIVEKSIEAMASPVVEKMVTTQQSLNKADYEKMADEFISFDYSTQVSNVAMKAPQAVSSKVVQAPVKVKAHAVAAPVAMQKENEQLTSNALKSQKSLAQSLVMSIQSKATNLQGGKSVKNFEVRFQDDLNEIYEDYGSGEVQLTTRVSSVMNRSMVLLKRGYAPTNTDLIIENNSKVTLPLIEEQVFNSLLDKVTSSSAVGALLVEFDDDTEAVVLDAEYAEVILLDEKLKTVKDESYRYKLFIGLNAGNVFVTYKQFNGTAVAKIVHIHEREVSFDANIYEDIKHSQVILLEEGLLTKELSPLILTSEQVRVFATEIVAKKQNQNTYKLNKKKSLLGDRQYLEVNHLDEPVFVGYRDNNKIALPSDNFINFVLSKFEDRKLGNRCIIQVNIDSPVANYYVGTESVGSSLVTSSQVLDQDGKFYDSVGPKSNKIIILGENHGSPDHGQDGKVNIKIDYLDGSSRFLSSYCSPNTYLVEQL